MGGHPLGLIIILLIKNDAAVHPEQDPHLILSGTTAQGRRVSRSSPSADRPWPFHGDLPEEDGWLRQLADEVTAPPKALRDRVGRTRSGCDGATTSMFHAVRPRTSC